VEEEPVLEFPPTLLPLSLTDQRTHAVATMGMDAMVLISIATGDTSGIQGGLAPIRAAPPTMVGRVDWFFVSISVTHFVSVSADASVGVYTGAFAFSEPEAKAVADYIESRHNVQCYIDFHSYSQMWMSVPHTLLPPSSRRMRIVYTHTRCRVMGSIAMGVVNKDLPQ